MQRRRSNTSCSSQSTTPPRGKRGRSMSTASEGAASTATTTPEWAELKFVWKVGEFKDMRLLAKSKALTRKDHLFSPTFGDKRSGFWRLQLYPYGHVDSSQGAVSLYTGLDPESNTKEAAERDADAPPCTGVAESSNVEVRASYRLSLLNEDGTPIPEYVVAPELVAVFGGEKKGLGKHDFVNASDSSVLQRILIDGALTIQCEIRRLVTSPDDQSLSAMRSMEGFDEFLMRSPSLQDDVTEYCGKNPTATDVFVRCNDELIGANRLLLSARSMVFEAMLGGAFNEGSQNVINIYDISTETAKRLVHFVMTDDFDLSAVAPEQRVAALVEALTAADKYQIPSLYSRCVGLLTAEMDSRIVFDVLPVAIQINCAPLQERCIKLLQSVTAHHLISHCDTLPTEKDVDFIRAADQQPKDVRGAL
eukprot:GHVU01156881.1.p1 GENE.GHVU01156881.1~~GHVU01156881.1.p1  ORF type:complete len:421 (+),score=67.37 GHVU01156881.1:203-1465(+)